MKKIVLNFGDAPLINFMKVYEDFLTYEHSTTFPELWREQKKVYLEILKAPDPHAALEEFRKLNATTHEVAMSRLGSH